MRSEGKGERPRQGGGRRGASLVVDLILFTCVLALVVEFEIKMLVPATASRFVTFGSRINVIARFVGPVTMCFGFLPRWFLQVRALRG